MYFTPNSLSLESQGDILSIRTSCCINNIEFCIYNRYFNHMLFRILNCLLNGFRHFKSFSDADTNMAVTVSNYD